MFADFSVPFISVILPIRNEQRFIAATLKQLAEQHYPAARFELLVVDGESVDATVEVARAALEEHPNLKWQILSNPRRLSSAARNIGIDRSVGDYVLIVDGHVDIPNCQLLANAAEIIKRTGATVLGRPQRLSANGLTRTQKIIAATRASRLGHAPDSHIYSLQEGWASPASIAVMYKKTLFERFGYFDESFDAAEDLEFNTRLQRAGLQAYTSPKLEVFYYPRESLGALFRQMRRYGAGRARLWRKYHLRPSLLALAPAGMLAGGAALVAGSMINVLNTPALAILLVCTILYGALVRWVQGQDQDLKRYPFGAVLKTLLVIHLGLGVGILEGFIGNRFRG